jgi:hypothetical protein
MNSARFFLLLQRHQQHRAASANPQLCAALAASTAQLCHRLAFVFEINDIACSRENCQEINVIHAGLALFITFVEIKAFTNNFWACASFILFVTSQ